jgi:hypothetical protein
LLQVAVRLRWTPDWRLVARSAVLPVRYLNPCQMTIARLDVTPLLDRSMRGQLAQTVRDAVDVQVPRLTDLRSQVAPAWARLNRPLPLGEDAWLLLQPQGVRAAPFFGSGSRVSTVVGLMVRPRIVPGEPPATAVRELPRLQFGLPQGAGLRLPVRVALSYDDAADELARRLAGRSFRFGTYTLVFSEPRLSALGGRLSLTLQVSGDLAGRVTVTGRPVIDADTEIVSLQELDYELETKDTLATTNIGVFRGAILRRLSEQARWSFSEQMDQARRSLEGTLNRDLGPSMSLRVFVQELQPISVRGDGQRIRVDVLVRGAARLSGR